MDGIGIIGENLAIFKRSRKQMFYVAPILSGGLSLSYRYQAGIRLVTSEYFQR